LLLSGGHFLFVFAQGSLGIRIRGKRLRNPARHVLGVTLERARRGEDAGHRVIVALGNRIEFVIVAAGATDGLPEESFTEGIELLVDDVEAQLLLVLFLVIRGAEGEKGRGDGLPPGFLRSRRGQEIAGELLANEAVERFIRIESFDDVIAITPGILEKKRPAATAGLGKARHIQPVPAPSFAETRRGEEAIDGGGDGFLRIRRRQ
jgi:hypothetical protein